MKKTNILLKWFVSIVTMYMLFNCSVLGICYADVENTTPFFTYSKTFTLPSYKYNINADGLLCVNAYQNGDIIIDICQDNIYYGNVDIHEPFNLLSFNDQVSFVNFECAELKFIGAVGNDHIKSAGMSITTEENINTIWYCGPGGRGRIYLHANTIQDVSIEIFNEVVNIPFLTYFEKDDYIKQLLLEIETLKSTPLEYDYNRDGLLTLSDIIYLARYLAEDDTLPVK